MKPFFTYSELSRYLDIKAKINMGLCLTDDELLDFNELKAKDPEHIEDRMVKPDPEVMELRIPIQAYGFETDKTLHRFQAMISNVTFKQWSFVEIAPAKGEPRKFIITLEDPTDNLP